MGSNDITLMDVLRAVRRSWWVVLGVAILGVGGAGVLVIISVPAYRVTALLAPSESKPSVDLSSLGGLASLAGLDLQGGRGSTEEALATLKSRAFLVAFIKDNDLLPVLFGESWDPQKKAWLAPEADVPTLGDGFRLFKSKVIEISKQNDTGLIELRVEWQEPATAARWAEGLVKALNDQLRRRDIEEAEKSLRYLERELEKTSIFETREAIYKLIESQVKTVMIAHVRDDYAFRMVDRPIAFEDEVPVWPNRSVMLAVGLAFGLSLGILVAVLVRNYDLYRFNVPWRRRARDA